MPEIRNARLQEIRAKSLKSTVGIHMRVQIPPWHQKDAAKTLNYLADCSESRRRPFAPLQPKLGLTTWLALASYASRKFAQFVNRKVHFTYTARCWFA
jgi:hypothetical protein